MSNIKCPFCGELLKDDIAQINNLEVFKCPKCFKFANESTWQGLIRTRKALDVAVDALKELRPTEKKSCYLVPTVSTTQRIIDEALEQITALTKGDQQ